MMKLPVNSAARFIFATIAYLVILSLGLEMALRMPLASSILGTATVNSGNAHLDIKAVSIDNYQRTTGPIDCLIIGASDATAGINPALIESHHCYNFGLGALHSNEALILMDILLKKYGIKLLVVAASPYFFLPGEDSRYLLTDHWLCCYNGRYDFQGMLLHHSAAYQYSQLAMMRLFEPRYYTMRQGFEYEVSANGYKPRFGSMASDDPELAKMIRRVAIRNNNIVVTVENHTYPNTALVDYLTKLEAQGIEVVLIQLRPRPEFFERVPETWFGYDVFDSDVLPMLTDGGVTFLDPFQDLTLTNDNWYDATHLNDQGATAISSWLNDQLNALAND